MAETLGAEGRGASAGDADAWNRLPGPTASPVLPPPGPTLSIGAGCSFEGLLTFRGAARVDGELVGDVMADGSLILGETARVRGRIEVDELIVAGEVEGDIVARCRIELSASARVVGSIESPRLALADGCVFRGRCRCVS